MLTRPQKLNNYKPIRTKQNLKGKQSNTALCHCKHQIQIYKLYTN